MGEPSAIGMALRRLNDRTATIAAATRLKNRSIRQRLGVRARLSLPHRNGGGYQNGSSGGYLERVAPPARWGFGIQLNKNSFGMTTSQPLNIPLLNAGQTLDVALPMTCTGPVQKMDPLTNIQVAIKNSIDIFYFACIAPLHIFFSEEGAMEKKTFLNTWKDIPA